MKEDGFRLVYSESYVAPDFIGRGCVYVSFASSVPNNGVSDLVGLGHVERVVTRSPQHQTYKKHQSLSMRNNIKLNLVDSFREIQSNIFIVLVIFVQILYLGILPSQQFQLGTHLA